MTLGFIVGLKHQFLVDKPFTPSWPLESSLHVSMPNSYTLSSFTPGMPLAKEFSGSPGIATLDP
jgi:hypothetical protein